jgi:hypothetical protein
MTGSPVAGLRRVLTVSAGEALAHFVESRMNLRLLASHTRADYSYVDEKKLPESAKQRPLQFTRSSGNATINRGCICSSNCSGSCSAIILRDLLSNHTKYNWPIGGVI